MNDSRPEKADPQKSKKPWGGRFSEPIDSFVERFTASYTFDRRLFDFDIECSRAHASMLASIGVLSRDDLEKILGGLDQILAEGVDAISWSPALEDVHMHLEARLVELIGEAGKRLHTGRSRNDQVATDLRLFVRSAIDEILGYGRLLLEALLTRAEEHVATPMPGFTHLQTAQPVTFGHHLMAWFEMVLRDVERLIDCRKRLNSSPLGAAALAGSTFPLDREATRAALGFDRLCENSLDAVSDRDFALEFCAHAAIAMVHLSRMCEELVLWSSPGFGFVELPERFCTGSSIMPQKKNPDVPELIRGKCGRVCGALQSLLVMAKGQPLAYNKDNQEDKEPLFDSVDTWTDSWRALAALAAGLNPNPDAMRRAATQGMPLATDLADYLVGLGLSFRDAHERVGKIVRACEDSGRLLESLSLEELQSFHQDIGPEVREVLSLDSALARRDQLGGTAPAQVRAAVARARQRLEALLPS